MNLSLFRLVLWQCLLLVILILLGCCSQKEQDTSEETYVHTGVVHIEPTVILGDSGEGAFLSLGVDYTSIAADTVFVLDGPGRQVIAFNINGEVLYRFGHAGEGPGEFKVAGTITVLNNRLYIGDRALRRVSVFSITGRYLDSFSLPGPPTSLAAKAGYLYVGIRSSTILVLRISEQNYEGRKVLLDYEHHLLEGFQGFIRITSPKLTMLNNRLVVGLPNAARILIFTKDDETIANTFVIENDLTKASRRYYEDKQARAEMTVILPVYLSGLSTWQNKMLLVQMYVLPREESNATILVIDPDTGGEKGPRLIRDSYRYLYLKNLPNGFIAWSALDEATVGLYQIDPIVK